LVGQPDVCPECGLRVPSAALRSLRNVAAGASAVMTLMACYGAGYTMQGPPRDRCDGYDADGDGVCMDVDCDDADAQVGPCEETTGEETDTQPLVEPSEEPTEDLDGA
jgi:hypothetical protein